MKRHVKLRTYGIISRAVEEGVAAGWRHAIKHQEALVALEDLESIVLEQITRDVMAALDEVIDFDL